MQITVGNELTMKEYMSVSYVIYENCVQHVQLANEIQVLLLKQTGSRFGDGGRVHTKTLFARWTNASNFEPLASPLSRANWTAFSTRPSNNSC